MSFEWPLPAPSVPSTAEAVPAEPEAQEPRFIVVGQSDTWERIAAAQHLTLDALCVLNAGNVAAGNVGRSLVVGASVRVA